MRALVLLPLLILTACFQTHSEDDLRTVPVTNNPTIVPNYGNGMPGIGGSGQQGPY